MLEDVDFLKPSSEFKKRAFSVVLSIVVFFLFYFILIAVAALMVSATIWAGIKLTMLRRDIFTVIIGAGISVVGMLFAFFLLKFIFSKRKDENPQRVQITKKDYPRLFDFLERLTKDTKTKFPKKVFISPDVNARVFYNSSIWSLFFPVRRHLEIGLGLVNTLNVSEFKSVLAHEFGHFSQYCMTIGRYIYTANRVIYNLIFEYDTWDIFLSKWIRERGTLGFFASLTFHMVENVRKILRQAYLLINLNYMKLAREMEYHADLVAVSVAGNHAFKNALRKMEFSTVAYEYALDYLLSLARRQKASTNIYHDHQFTLNFLAKRTEISRKSDVFEITDEDLKNTIVRSRIHIEDQWASHPSYWEREASISNFEIECDENTNPTWVLFADPEELQEKISKKVYDIAFPHATFDDLSESEFREFVREKTNKFRISDKYNRFYNSRYLTEFDPKVLAGSTPTARSFEAVYSKENVEMLKRHDQNKADLALLEHIWLQENNIENFEFDGKKYNRYDADGLIETLKKEIEKEDRLVEKIDKESFLLNYTAASKAGLGSQLIQYYEDYFSSLKLLQGYNRIFTKLQRIFDLLYSRPRWTEVEITQIALDLLIHEKEFKNFLRCQDISIILPSLDDPGQREVLKAYLDLDNFYTKPHEFDETSFHYLMNMATDIQAIIATKFGKTVKEMTDFQLQFYQDANDNSSLN